MTDPVQIVFEVPGWALVGFMVLLCIKAFTDLYHTQLRERLREMDDD